jgi:hypothetical protein
MIVRAAVLSFCVVVAAILAWIFVPSLLRTEGATKVVAEQVLKEEFARLGVRQDAFAYVDAQQSGLDWIVTWKSKIAPSAEIGVTITPFEADVWGYPMLPDCKGDRARTIIAFGEVCLVSL